MSLSPSQRRVLALIACCVSALPGLLAQSLYHQRDSTLTITQDGDTVISYSPNFIDLGEPLQPTKDNGKKPDYSKAEREAFFEAYRNQQKEREAKRIESLAQEYRERSRDGVSYAVGEIPIYAGVSPTGGRTYQIPIPTAPGIRFAPSVSLVYNSQAGDGAAGYGWDLAGIPSISLINQNVYYHGQAKAADIYNATDPVFALDGVPIVQNDDPATSQAFPYATARGHILVSKQLDNQGFIKTFTVLYPDGNKGIFSSVVDNPGSNLPIYPLVHLENLQRDSIVFHYYSGGLSFDRTLAHIEYGFNASGYPEASLYFGHTVSSDYAQRFFAGKSLSHAYCISNIESRNGSDVIRRFELTHETRDNVRLLTQVDCYSGGEQLKPLYFSYGIGGTAPSAQDSLKLSGSVYLTSAFPQGTVDICNIRGKFLEGRFSDGTLMYPEFDNYTVIDRSGWLNKKYKYGSSYDPSQSILCAASMDWITSVDNSLVAGRGFQTIAPADVDGDGADEIVRVGFGESTAAGDSLLLSVYRCNPSGHPVLQSSFSCILNGTITEGNFKSPYQRKFLWGDFDGNGKVQLLSIAYDSNFNNAPQASYAALIDVSTGTLLSEDILFSFPLTDASCVFAFDYDGDGRTELCRITSSGLQVYRLGSTGHFSLPQTYSNVSIYGASTPFYITDLNADGYLDIVSPPFLPGSSTWYFYSFDGHSFEVLSYAITGYSEDNQYFFLDVNRDGLADLIRTDGQDITAFLNTTGFSFAPGRTSQGIISDLKGISPANLIHGSGMSSFIKIEGYTVNLYDYSAHSPEFRALVSSQDSYYKFTLSDYVFLPTRDAYWAEGSPVNHAAGFKLQSLPVYVLSSSSAYVSIPSYTTYQQLYYSFHDPVIHNQGLGFCGFTHRQERDYLSGAIRIRDVVTDPQRMGIVTSETLRLQSESATPWSSTAYTYDNHSTVHGKLSPRVTRILSSDTRTGIGTDVTYGSYDAYDFPTLIRTDRHLAPDTVSTYEILHRTYTHSTAPSKYVLGVVTEETLSRERDGNVSSSWQERDSTACDSLFRPISTKHFVGVLADSLVRETRWAYDTHGNVTSEKTAPYGASVFTGDTLVYDNVGRYLLSKTDALGRTVSYSGYDKFGNPASATDHKGRTTSFTYDAWGRQVSKARPDGAVEQTTLSWGGAGLFTVSRTETGKPESVTHFDAFGREIRSGMKRFDTQWQYTDKEYDARGRLYRTSVPYRGTAPSLWNVHAYDDYDRPISITEASGRVSTWSYSGTSTTTVKDSVATTTTTDAFGDVVQVSDPGGTIRYALRDDGQPISITAPGNVTTTFTYDGFGRRTAIIDPSAGTRTEQWTWEPDGSSIVAQSNPNGTVSTHADRFGRTTLVERSGAHSTAYTYDNDGLLLSMISSNGADRVFTYDVLDRIATITDTVGTSWRKRWIRKTYTYGSGSVLSSIKYTSPDGDITTESYTYANGHNTGITLPDNTTVWSLVSENDLGAPTQITTGGVTRQYGYTATGLPTFRKMGCIATGGPGSIQHFTYQFDPHTGNLLSRTDVNHSQTESFTYDSLNRLISMNNRPVTYDNASGNITAIGNVGTMSYGNTSHPYQITALSPAADSLVSFGLQSIQYTSFDRPATLHEGLDSASFQYGCNGERVRAELIRTDGFFETWSIIDFFGERYECIRDGDILPTRELLYLGGDAYSAPMVYVKEYGGNWTLYNIGRDYLGSITNITLDVGFPVAEYSYDPWGRLRDPQTLAIYARGNEPALFLRRGFTGHEHLPQFGLINMNARLYDPLVGRFLSPDPYVQDPESTQGFNRYSYALNNPLKYIDETGEYAFVDDLVAALLGGAINWALNGFKFTWEGAMYFAVGSLSGLMTLYAPEAESAILGITSGLNSIVRQGYSSGEWDPSLIDPMRVCADAALGVATSYVGGQFSSWLSNTPILSWTSNIGSQAASLALNRGLSNGISGFILGTGLGMIATEGDWEESLKMGAYSGLTGLSLGTVSGLIEGYFQNKPTSQQQTDAQDELVSASDLGLENEVDRINSGKTYTYRHDRGHYYNNPDYLPNGPSYTEFIVPPTSGKGAGTWRIIVGSDNQWYFTPDHHKTFIKFKP